MEELPANRTEPVGASPGYSEMPVYVAGSELEKRARQIGTIAGQVVALIRETKHFLDPGEQRDELRAKASSKVAELREQVSERAEEWGYTVRQRSAELGRRAKAGFEEARERADRLGHDYPWHLLVAGGIAGFVLGVVLRVRRASRAV
jgi:ElaB/YqjD/DUF883 family membrane-anchored ribosome-binding protein